MTSTYTYEQILELKDLSVFHPSEAIGILGRIFETSLSTNNIATLDKGLKLAESLRTESLPIDLKAHYHYNVANGWAYRLKLRSVPSDIEFYNDELINEILNIRLALGYCTYEDCDFLKSQLYVNLGNIFSHLGRSSEAITLWQKSLQHNPNFGMAIGNLGYGVFHYGKLVYDDFHQLIFMQFAHKALSEGIKSDDVYIEAKNDFRRLINSIENAIERKRIYSKINLNKQSLGRSLKEKKYRKWCLDNVLFINTLNDIHIASIAANDYLNLPSITQQTNNDTIIYYDLFNQIKQEYISARYFIYMGISARNTHFSDRRNFTTNTTEPSLNSLNIEALKSGFRMCYSILDKIALFINEFYRLNTPTNKVSFNKIWYNYNKKGVPENIKVEVVTSKNWMLRGLYWLSRDLFSKELETTDPEARNIAKIRNFIEHKSFKITECPNFKEIDDKSTLIIDKHYFESQCIKLIKLTRSAIIYLCLSVKVEESKSSLL